MRDNNPVSTTDASAPTPPTASSGTTPNVGWRANPSPYARFDRHEWDALADRTPLPLTQEDIDQIASLGDPIDMTEVDTDLPAPCRPSSSSTSTDADASPLSATHS